MNSKKVKIISGNLDENNIVEKSRPLLFMKDTSFGIGELKVLDTYLSRINARNSSNRTVVFSKEEYEDLIGIEQMRPERLSKYVDNVMGKTVTVPEEDGGWRKYVLFTESRCYKNASHQWFIELTCSREAKKLFFDIENIGYIRYQLKNILPMTSKYSIMMYFYFLGNLYRKDWSESIANLHNKVLRLKKEEYPEFKYLKRNIIDKSIKEINTYSNITATYTAEKSGRNIIALHFTVSQNTSLLSSDDASDDAIETNSALHDVSEDYEDNFKNDSLRFLAGACNYEFSEEQMQLIFDIICTMTLPEVSEPTRGIAFSRYHFLKEQYSELIIRENRTDLPPLKNRFAYFKGNIQRKKGL